MREALKKFSLVVTIIAGMSLVSAEAKSQGNSRSAADELNRRSSLLYEKVSDRAVANGRRCAPHEMQWTGQDPWTNRGPFEVRAMVYGQPVATASGGPARPVLIIPPTGGTTILDRSLAQKICDKGGIALILSHFSGIDDAESDWKLHDRGSLRGVTAIRWMIHWLRESSGVSSVGIAGASVGAIYSALVASIDTRIDRAVFIAGGAPLADVVTESDQETVAAIRRARIEREKIASLQDYRARLQIEIELDVGKLLSRQPGREDLVFVGLSDTTVPTATQRYLVDALKPKRVIELNSGHFWTIFRAQAFHSETISDFLLKMD